MSQILILSRQREQTLIFIAPEGRQLNRNIVSAANVIIFKALGILQLEFNRVELSPLASQANAAFVPIKGYRCRSLSTEEAQPAVIRHRAGHIGPRCFVSWTGSRTPDAPGRD